MAQERRFRSSFGLKLCFFLRNDTLMGSCKKGRQRKKVRRDSRRETYSQKMSAHAQSAMTAENSIVDADGRLWGYARGRSLCFPVRCLISCSLAPFLGVESTCRTHTVRNQSIDNDGKIPQKTFGSDRKGVSPAFTENET